MLPAILGVLAGCAQVRGPAQHEPIRADSLRVENLRTEYATNPIGVGERTPRMSWMIESDARNVMQASYEIRVARTLGELRKGDTIWNSGQVRSDDFAELHEGTAFRVCCNVRFAGDGEPARHIRARLGSLVSYPDVSE